MKPGHLSPDNAGHVPPDNCPDTTRTRPKGPDGQAPPSKGGCPVVRCQVGREEKTPRRADANRTTKRRTNGGAVVTGELLQGPDLPADVERSIISILAAVLVAEFQGVAGATVDSPGGTNRSDLGGAA